MATKKRTEVRQHIAEVEDMRETWIKRIRTVLARQMTPLRSLDPAAMPAQMKADRDAWISELTQAYTMVATAFATHTVGTLASLADVPDFDESDPSYRAAFSAFLSTYLATHVPQEVDRVADSFSTRLSDLIAHTSSATKADPHKPESFAARGSSSPYPKTPSVSDAEDEYDDGISGEIEGPSFDDLIDMLFDSVELIMAGMVVVAASGLGALGSADAFGEAYDIELIKIWSAVDDNVTRPSHADADGQEQALEDPFTVGDSELLFPLDDSLGADIGEIIYCRCVVMFDIAGAKHLHRPRTWADHMREIVIMNLPHVAGQEARNA